MQRFIRVTRMLLAGLLICAGSAFAAPQSININTASASELAAVLDGVGTARAEAIVDYREQIGGFQNIDELEAVRGIGRHVIETNRDLMRIGD